MAFPQQKADDRWVDFIGQNSITARVKKSGVRRKGDICPARLQELTSVFSRAGATNPQTERKLVKPNVINSIERFQIPEGFPFPLAQLEPTRR